MLSNILGNEIKFLINLNISKTKLMILKVLIIKQPLNIMEIQKNITKEFNLKKSFNYKTIWQHVQELQKKSLIILKKENQSTGTPNQIYLTPLIAENKKSFLNYLDLILNEKSVSKFQNEAKKRNSNFLKSLK